MQMTRFVIACYMICTINVAHSMKKSIKPLIALHSKFSAEGVNGIIEHYNQGWSRIKPSAEARKYFEDYKNFPPSCFLEKQRHLKKIKSLYLIDHLHLLLLAYNENIKEILEEINLDPLVKKYAGYIVRLPGKKDVDPMVAFEECVSTSITSKLPITNFALVGNEPIIIIESKASSTKKSLYTVQNFENHAYSKTDISSLVDCYKNYIKMVRPEGFSHKSLYNKGWNKTILLGAENYQLYDNELGCKVPFYDRSIKKDHTMKNKALASFSLDNRYVAFLIDPHTIEIGSVSREKVIKTILDSAEEEINSLYGDSSYF